MVSIIIVVVVVIIAWIHLRSNTKLKDVLNVDAKRNGDIYPPPFLVTCLRKSDAV
jgi:hypothetical protein